MTWAIPRVVQSFAPSRRRTPDAAQRGRSGQLYFERPLSSTANGGSGSGRDARGRFALQLRKTEIPVQTSAGVYLGLIIEHQEVQPSANSIDNVHANKPSAAWANQALRTPTRRSPQVGAIAPQCLNAPTKAVHARRAA